MCLIVVHFGIHPDLPLVVGANRDERYARATQPVRLWPSRPRFLAGRDDVASGTWLTVNEWGVVAGLTNQPMPGGPDTSKRSRGDLPLISTEHESAVQAVEAFIKTVDPAEYNPCWLLIGDRARLFALEVRADAELVATELSPGRHVLENSPIDMPTAKSVAVTALDSQIASDTPQGLVSGLIRLLSNHDPAPVLQKGTIDPRGARRPELSSACVHTDNYGTRSSTIILVHKGSALPTVHSADGPPCVTEFRDCTPLWDSVPES